MNLIFVNKISKYGSYILGSEYFKGALGQTHHNFTTVGDHSLHVAYYSLLICALLIKIGIRISERELVRASLCHDLGIVGRGDKYKNNRECCKMHPLDSKQVAEKLLDDLSDKERDAISNHMWPLNIHCPHSKEGWIISFADKISATSECFAPHIMKRRDEHMINDLGLSKAKYGYVNEELAAE